VSEDALCRQKRTAVAGYSRTAAAFAERYSQLNVDPYETCYASSRYRLQKLMGGASAGATGRPEAAGRVLCHRASSGSAHTVGFDVAGVDGSEEMIALAQARNPTVMIRYGDVEALPFPSGGVHVVVCVEVLRYLPGPSDRLREMAQVLRPGGLCQATATAVLNLTGHWLINRLSSRFGTPGLTRLRQAFSTSSRLRRELEMAGFESPRVRGVYFGQGLRRFVPMSWRVPGPDGP
jgi:SAM-dependent methyltransferase